MTGKVLKSVIELVEENPSVDNRAVFERLWGITEKMIARIHQRFDTQLDPCCEVFQDYRTLSSTAGEGSLKAYSGKEIDWLIHSYIGSPEASFTNMHITISLGPQYLVPNFGFALGTIPDLFLYMDYIPRTDLLLDIDYADKYYEDVNEEFLQLQADARFKPFISRDLYTRIAMTPTAVGYCADRDPDVIDLVERIAHQRLDRWLRWVDEAEQTPLEIRQKLMQRDEQIRRNICERDPANNLAERLFGEETAHKMVATLWGGNRTLPRPDGSR